MDYDYSELRGRIIAKFKKLEAFAAAMGITPTTLGKKLQGGCTWKQEEIAKAINLLCINPEDIAFYFFTQRVENFTTKYQKEAI